MAQARSGTSEDKMMQGREAVENFASRAREEGDRILSTASEKVSDLSTQIADRASDVKMKVGDKMTSLAGSIRESAPSGGTMSSAAHAVADGLDTSGTYLSKDFAEMADDVTTVVKRYPMQAICAGIGLGFLVGSYLTSSRK